MLDLAERLTVKLSLHRRHYLMPNTCQAIWSQLFIFAIFSLEGGQGQRVRISSSYTVSRREGFLLYTTSVAISARVKHAFSCLDEVDMH